MKRHVYMAVGGKKLFVACIYLLLRGRALLLLAVLHRNFTRQN